MVRFDLFSLQKVLQFSDRESAVRCARCMKVCTGETLRFNDQLFHANCLVCLGMYPKSPAYFNRSFCPPFGIACHSSIFIRKENYMFEIHVILLSEIRTNSSCENGLFM